MNWKDAVDAIDFPVITDFLQGRFEETGRLEFMFARGLVMLNWYEDSEEGKKILKNFLDLSNGRNGYDALREKAQSKISA